LSHHPPFLRKVSGARAAAFYEGNGFVRLPESMRPVLPKAHYRKDGESMKDGARHHGLIASGEA
jgi:hypothetical protein